MALSGIDGLQWVKTQTISRDCSKLQGKIASFLSESRFPTTLTVSVRRPLRLQLSDLALGRSYMTQAQRSRDTNQRCVSQVLGCGSSGPSARPAPSRVWPLSKASRKGQARPAFSVSESPVQVLPFQSWAATPAQTVCVPTRASGHCEGNPILLGMGRKPPCVLLALSKGRSAVHDRRSAGTGLPAASCTNRFRNQRHALRCRQSSWQSLLSREAERDGRRCSRSPNPEATRKCLGNRAHVLSHSERASPPWHVADVVVCRDGSPVWEETGCC